MKRKLLVVLVLTLVILCQSQALAIQKLGLYSLCVNHDVIPMSSETGFLYRNGQAFMIPIKLVSESLGLSYSESDDGIELEIIRRGGKKLLLRAGSAIAKFDGKAYRLRYKTIKQKNGLFICDVKAVKYLQSGFKHYRASVAKPYGYVSGVLVISSDEDLSLPPISPQPDVLPEKLRQAAELTRQIVGVRYISGSQAVLTLYEKANGVWLEQYSTNACVGSNGIGKTKEGDKKTPEGMFNLTKPFGILPDPGCKMKGYLKVNKNHYWCSNTESRYYNRLVDISKTDYTPVSADEHLIDIAPFYNYALFIDYNAQCVPGAGSAIFLHCKGSKSSTSGCISVSANVMRSLIMTLDDGAKIVIYR